MRNFAICFLVALCHLIGVLNGNVFAGNNPEKLTLCVLLNDGTEVYCDFTKRPQMSFSNDVVSLVSVEGTVGEWVFADVKSWSFADSEVLGIDAKKEDNGSVISFSDDCVKVCGSDGDVVNVYDTDGRLVIRRKLSKDGIALVQFLELKGGVYVFKSGRNSIKFIIR